MNYKKKHLVDFVMSRCDITDYPLTRVEVEKLTKKNLMEIIKSCELEDELNYHMMMRKERRL